MTRIFERRLKQQASTVLFFYFQDNTGQNKAPEIPGFLEIFSILINDLTTDPMYLAHMCNVRS
ncbi:hypothetical protein NBRC3257_2458 [Gluconobacter thailandicus NBRC 3257]|uniref:Transposase n=1 Tax=Gluconobacter thailandicus NBRC 3257 TaxID=1381097 RepID=A0ABQ0IZ21_GLUTH|nr:hypothetical protein AD940_12425 [Gluconobacter thailandicus]GAC87020.1 hypothetical protein NBRC3255_0681 [Gluconobacter thailandicus NBRC 3255]GAD27459.1 hypothetical protein NBRC3257_2458 [Gluconobacter thailandicus NBRC 3257]